jgi:hypothetical protein
VTDGGGGGGSRVWSGNIPGVQFSHEMADSARKTSLFHEHVFYSIPEKSLIFVNSALLPRKNIYLMSLRTCKRSIGDIFHMHFSTTKSMN